MKKLFLALCVSAMITFAACGNANVQEQETATEDTVEMVEETVEETVDTITIEEAVEMVEEAPAE